MTGMALWWRGELPQSPAQGIAWARGQRLLPLLLWRAEQQGWVLPEAVLQGARRAGYGVQARQLLAHQAGQIEVV